MPKVTEPHALPTVGVVGGGQLARMMAEAAGELDLPLALLAAGDEDCAVPLVPTVAFGSPLVAADLERFAQTVDVLTFDHELVDLEALSRLELAGAQVFPSSRALRFAVDKAHQRRVLHDLGLPVPDFLVLETPDDAAVTTFVRNHGVGVVVKSARGGYDGRGVAVLAPEDDAVAVVRDFLAGGTVVLEERLPLLAEVAVSVVTGRDGSRVHYPPVRTVQRDGMCVEVHVPSGLDDDVEREATDVALRVAELVGAVGVLAVELFVTARAVVVNEVATRPHNSGHWSIEGAACSQFENHLRAVAGLPLGATTPTARRVAMVNVVGGTAPGSLEAALRVPGAHVHDYGKAWRRGRKLGHVTTVGDNGGDVRTRAWDAAIALGMTKETP